MPLTKAQRRVLEKIRSHGQVLVAGGFSGRRAPRRNVDLGPTADRRGVIEHLVAKRLVKPGPAFNSYVNIDPSSNSATARSSSGVSTDAGKKEFSLEQTP